MTLPTNTNGMRVLNTLPQKNNTKDQRTPPTYLSAISRKTFFLSLPFFQPLLSLLLQTSSHLFRTSFLFSKANQMPLFHSLLPSQSLTYSLTHLLTYSLTPLPLPPLSFPVISNAPFTFDPLIEPAALFTGSPTFHH